jgi:hypothetical protein
MVEILSGISSNDKIVVDGAGFLTNEALIKVSSDTSAKSTSTAKE